MGWIKKVLGVAVKRSTTEIPSCCQSDRLCLLRMFLKILLTCAHCHLIVHVFFSTEQRVGMQWHPWGVCVCVCAWGIFPMVVRWLFLCCSSLGTGGAITPVVWAHWLWDCTHPRLGFPWHYFSGCWYWGWVDVVVGFWDARPTLASIALKSGCCSMDKGCAWFSMENGALRGQSSPT